MVQKVKATITKILYTQSNTNKQQSTDNYYNGVDFGYPKNTPTYIISKVVGGMVKVNTLYFIAIAYDTFFSPTENFGFWAVARFPVSLFLF